MDYPKEVLTRLYQTMLRIRYCEESLVPPILKGDIRCPVHLCTGQEAVAAGIGAVLEKKDYIFGNHRSHGHYLAKGGGMPELIAEINGKETGCSKGRGGSMHLIDPQAGMLGSAPIVAGTIPLALGAALASSIRKDNRVTVSFFGDGATGEGVLYESLNFAALKRLPLIFACENNLYSTHLQIEEIGAANSLSGIAKPFGIKSFKVDGNDVLKVYEYAQKAVEHCRKGEGPVFIEFLTYRIHGHVGPDDNVHGTHTDIRPKSEVEKWRKKDPIKKIERYLLRNGILIKKELLTFHEQIRQEVDAAHVFASNSLYPKKEEIDSYVFIE
jgi:acetoin:2,6-dichlorophenolindophenol oxidoreductase subunit alpha